MSRVAVLAVDGGNSKTDVALVNADGSVLALVRGALSSPQHLGVDGALAVVEGLFGEALREAQLGYDPGRVVAQVATLLMAGVDFPAEEDAVRIAVEQRGWARRCVYEPASPKSPSTPARAPSTPRC
jgi:N-acetylglucosamine kinase-like BadF-type ATPase